MEKIFIYSQIIGGKEEEKHFEIVIFKIMKTIFKPHIKIFFDKLKNYKKENIIPKKEKIIKNENIIKPKEIKETKEIKENKENKEEEKYKKIHKRYLEYSPTHHKKARSYLYESFNESSLNMRPNSFDNDKWRKIQAKMQKPKYMLMSNDFEEEEEIDDNLDYYKYKKFNYPQNNYFNSKK